MSIILFLIVAFFLWHLAKELPFLAIIIGIGFGYIKAVFKSSVAETDNKRQRAYKEISQLSLLSLELKHYWETGQISQTQYAQSQKSIADRQQALCDFLWPTPYVQTQELEYAWKILKHHADFPVDEPPWNEKSSEPVMKSGGTEKNIIPEPQVQFDSIPIKAEPLDLKPINTETVNIGISPAQSLSISQTEMISAPLAEINSVPVSTDIKSFSQQDTVNETVFINTDPVSQID